MTIRKICSVRRAAAAVAVSLATAFPAGLLAPAAVADPVPTSTLATDAFNRSTSNNWGTADQGGDWTGSRSTNVSVASGRGRVVLNSGQQVVQSLPGSHTDTRTTVSVQVESLPTTGNGLSAGIGVRSSSSGAYTANLRFGRAGALSLSIKRQRTGSADVILVGDTLLPTRTAAGAPYFVQVEVVGASPVVVRARAWPQSVVAPGWQVRASDSDSARVTNSGGLSLTSYLSASTSPLRVSYDDVSVQKLSGSTDPTLPPVGPSPPTTGSLPVGLTSYAVPAEALYVAPFGSRTGSGTSASPYGSLGYAIEKAKSGSTIVMRGGNYHESTTVPFNKRLTIQSYPREAVWLDGSSVVTGWQRAGNTWVVSNWTHIFDHRVSDSKGVDQSNRFIDPAFPMAGYPDQVWVSGAKLSQVRSAQAVVAGTFFVDEPGRRLYVGTDPAGKQVDASTLQQGLVIQGAGTVVRGIGARRYGNTFWMGGAISAQVDNLVLEHVVSSQNATIGVNGWGKSMRFDHITVTESGALGLALNRVNDFRLTNSLVRENNIESFKQAPVSGGAKITNSERVLILGNGFDQNQTDGLWFDAGVLGVTVVGNRFNYNGGNGLELEWTSKAVVANNYFIRNKKAGVYIIDANTISLWNNTFFENETYSVRLFQDTRRSADPVFSMLVRDVTMRNNVLAYGEGSCQYLVDDYNKQITGQNMRMKSEGNAYHRASSSSPSNMVCWANGSSLASYKSLTAFRAATGNDLQSTLSEGTPILTSAYRLTPAALANNTSVALPVPSAVASLIGVADNTRALGAVSPIVK